MSDAIFSASRRTSMLALLGLAAGCGGGSGDPTPMAGSVQMRDITSSHNGTAYPLYLYLPRDAQVDRSTLPTVYLLDGESRFQTMVDIAEATRTRVIIVAIGNEAQRARDYVPSNLCTANGGGEAAFLAFIRLELIPFIDSTFGGDPKKRALLGHSHGGSFVLYALFAEPPGARLFSAYLASDASIDCMRATVYAWESDYAAAHTALPVRVHLSYGANFANEPFGAQLASRSYPDLRLAVMGYAGGHIGMIPAAFTDALAFAWAA